MAKVFVSYSRKDIAFAKRLTAELQKSEMNFWIDWEGIPPTVDWWREIEKGIEEADIFLFLISPDSAKSKVCGQEIDTAVKNAKRIIPLVVRDIDGEEAPKQLSHLNWIFFRESDDFDTAFQKLLTGIHTDYEWVQHHRWLQVRALDWVRDNRDKSSLLRGKDLQDVEFQLAMNSSKEPHPTDLQREYVFASRNDATQGQRITLAGVTIALVVSVTLGIIAYFQRQEAVTQASISRAGELAAQSELMLSKDLQHALLLGIESFRERSTAQSRGALLDATNASPQLIQILIGNSRPVSFLNLVITTTAFSPDGKLLASGNWDNSITIWDLEKRQPIGQLRGHEGTVVSMAFSPDGKKLISGAADYKVILWDVANLQMIGKPFSRHTNSINSVAFSPDGKTIASGSDDKRIILWNVETQHSILQPLTGHQSSVESIAFSPDGKTLASGGSDGQIFLWDLTSRHPVGSLLAENMGSIASIAFSPDGTHLAFGGSNRTITIWHIAMRQATEELAGHTGDVNSLAFSPDGYLLASGGNDKTVRLWNLASYPIQVTQLAGHTHFVNTVAFQQSGTLLSSSWDSLVILWDTTTRQPIVQSYVATETSIDHMVLSPKSPILATRTWDGVVYLWDIAAFQNRDSEKKLPLYQIDTTDPWKVTSNLAFSPDGKMLAFGNCKEIDSESGCLRGEVVLWDSTARRAVGQPLAGHTSQVTSVAFSPDGKLLASGSGDGIIFLWDPVTHEAISPPLKGHTWGIDSLAFHPDGKLLASASKGDRNIFLWDISKLPDRRSEDYKPFAQLVGHKDGVTSIVFSHDGKLLASGSNDATIILWDSETHQALGQPLIGHDEFVSSVAFSPDDQTLASGSWDYHVILWDIATGRALGQPLAGHNYLVSGVAFGFGGSVLISTSQNGTIFLWDVDPESWITKSCQRVGRNFTLAEWERYFPNDIYHLTCKQWAPEPEPTPIEWLSALGITVTATPAP